MTTPRLMLAVFLLAYLVAQAVWLQHNEDFDGNCVPGQLNYTADILNQTPAILSHAEGPGHALSELVAQLNSRTSYMRDWPRLVYAWSAATTLLWGRSERYPFYSNFLFVLLLVLGLVLCMRRLCPEDRRRDEGGFYAAALALLYPAVIGPSRQYGLDFPLTAVTALGLWALMRVEGFSRRGATLAFGVIAGFSVLVKGQYVLFMAVPGLYALGLAWRGPGAQPQREQRFFRLANVLLAALLILVIASVWYYGSLTPLFRSLFRHILEDYFPGLFGSATHISERSDDAPLSAGWYAFYVPVVLVYLEVAGVVGLLIGALLLARYRGALSPATRRDRRLLIVAAVAGFGVFSALTGKSPRYVFPLFPFFALITATGLMTLAPRLRRTLAGILIVSLGATVTLYSVDDDAHAEAHDARWQVFPDTEVDIFLKPPRQGYHPGLAPELATLLKAQGATAQTQIAFMNLPQNNDLQHTNNRGLYLTGYRLKTFWPCTDRLQPEHLDPMLLRHTCGLSLVGLPDMPAFFAPGHIGDELHMLVVFRFDEAYADFEPPYDDAFGQPLPEIAYARSAEEILAALPSGFRLIHETPSGDNNTILVFWRELPPLPGWLGQY